MVASTVAELSTWQHVAAIVLAAVVVSAAIRIVGDRLHARSSRPSDSLWRITIEELHPAVYRSVVLLSIVISGQFIQTGWLAFLVSSFALSGFVVQWTWTLARLGVRMFSSVQSGKRSADFAPVIRNLWKMVVFVIGFLILLSVWNVDITPLVASAGIIGIIVAVAAQGTFSNIFAGVALSFDQTYKVGDVLTLRSGERGTVTDISMRSTTLLTRDNVEITVPNTNLNEQRITNESTPRRRRRVRLPIGVAYSSDLQHVEEAIFEVAEDVEYVLEDPKPEVKYRAFGNSAVELEFMCHIRHPNLRGRTIDALIRGIHQQFHGEGITIPFPQRELSYLKEGARNDQYDLARAPNGAASARAESDDL